MNIKVGDKVKYIDEVGGGIVVLMRNGLLVVEDQDGFQYEIAQNAVVLDQKINYDTDEFKGVEGSSKPTSISGEADVAKELLAFHKGGKQPYLEIDLHIQHLISDGQRLSSHEMVLTQMSQVREMFDAARKHRYTKVVFIHGVGIGRLRHEIRNFLSQKSNCEFFDADFQKYGYGATEVRIWYN